MRDNRWNETWPTCSRIAVEVDRDSTEIIAAPSPFGRLNEHNCSVLFTMSIKEHSFFRSFSKYRVRLKHEKIREKLGHWNFSRKLRYRVRKL